MGSSSVSVLILSYRHSAALVSDVGVYTGDPVYLYRSVCLCACCSSTLSVLRDPVARDRRVTRKIKKPGDYPKDHIKATHIFAEHSV